MPSKITNALSVLHPFKHSPSSPKSPSTPPKSPTSPLKSNHTLSETMMEENISAAESIITKHAADPAPFSGNRRDARDFIESIKILQQSMQFFFISSRNETDSHHNLIRAQTLMESAMRKVEREFHHILTVHRYHLDPDSLSSHSSSGSELEFSGSEEESQIERVSVFDLPSIAECMISAGYGKECVKIYKTVRKSIVDEGVYTLEFERMTSHQIHKLDWEIAERKIKNWLNSSKIAVKNLFFGERSLCDRVFSSSPDSIKHSCFADSAKEAARDLFLFPESIATAKFKKSNPEKLFRILDLYDAVSDLRPDIESIFSYESTSAVRSQAASAMIKLGDVVRTMIHDFQAALQKNSSKSPVVADGGVHPLTRDIADYLGSLADYFGILTEVYSNHPLEAKLPLPETLRENLHGSPPPMEHPQSSIAARFVWIILILLCKLDGKAAHYKEIGLPYLFLANNLQYIVSKARCSNLRHVLGDEWISKYNEMVHQYVTSYKKAMWGKVVASLPEKSTVEVGEDAAVEAVSRFSREFQVAYRAQAKWVVPDWEMGEEIRGWIKNEILPVYRAFYVTACRAFYGKYRVLLGDESGVEVIEPDDLENQLSELFLVSDVSGLSLPSLRSEASR